MSTYNSNSRHASAPRWSLTWVLAIVVASAIVCAMEWHWRVHDYKPHIRDSAQLWSIQRDRVYPTDSVSLALLGASHIEYAIDMKLLKRLLPRYRPVMLAYNGHDALATLRDLARDTAFHGVVLCDIDARGLSNYYDGDQQAFVDYYHHGWSPSWHVHRLLLTDWQRVAIVGWTPFGAVEWVKRWIDHGPEPWRSPVRFHSDRSGDIDFSQVDDAAMARGFVNGLHEDLLKHPREPASQWLAELTRVRRWCDAIRRRGGKVIFFRTPTSGGLYAAENAAFPRADYWDRLSDAVRSPTLHALDVSFFRNLVLPDGSHVDYHDKPAYTRALVQTLVQRGLLQK
ncbi:MAG: hypothetical protein WBV39_05880 [Rudaea sp.]